MKTHHVLLTAAFCLNFISFYISENNKANSQFTQEMKRNAIIVILKAGYRDLEISRFLKFASSYIRKELAIDDGNVSPVSNRKKHSKRADLIRTFEFIQQVEQVIDDNPRKFMRSLAKDFHVSEAKSEISPTKTLVLCDEEGQFMSEKKNTKENR